MRIGKNKNGGMCQCIEHFLAMSMPKWRTQFPGKVTMPN